MKKSNLFGIEVDAIGMDAAIERILAWLEDPPGPCRYVVTPNVNHIVKLDASQAFRQAYRDASMVLADGRPVVWASRVLGRPLPGVVPGSDLIPSLFDRLASGDRRRSVYLLGAAPGVAQRASVMIQNLWHGIEVVGTSSPPFGFENVPRERDKVLAAIRAAKPDILIIGLGAPKQELWIHANRHSVDAKVALCVGAAIDFVAGEKARAPLWMREHGLEWLHRVASEPGRLSRRYAHDALVFPGLLAREMMAARDAMSGPGRSWSVPASDGQPSRDVEHCMRPSVGSTEAEGQAGPARDFDMSMAQLVSRIDTALGSRPARLLQFLGTSWGAGVPDVAFAYASLSAQLCKRRVLLISAEDPDVELGVLDCLQCGRPLESAVRQVSGTLSYTAFRGLREPDYAAHAMIAQSALWAKLRDGFDEVVVGSSTPHASQFGLVVASNVDAVMMVVDAEHTQIARVRDILDDLRSVRANVLGTIMNQRRLSAAAPARVVEEPA